MLYISTLTSEPLLLSCALGSSLNPIPSLLPCVTLHIHGRLPSALLRVLQIRWPGLTWSNQEQVTQHITCLDTWQITRPNMLWMSKKSIDWQVADHGNNQQLIKTHDTGERITLVMRANHYWLRKTMTHCIVKCSLSSTIVSDLIWLDLTHIPIYGIITPISYSITCPKEGARTTCI